MEARGMWPVVAEAVAYGLAVVVEGMENRLEEIKDMWSSFWTTTIFFGGVEASGFFEGVGASGLFFWRELGV